MNIDETDSMSVVRSVWKHEDTKQDKRQMMPKGHQGYSNGGLFWH